MEGFSVRRSCLIVVVFALGLIAVSSPGAEARVSDKADASAIRAPRQFDANGRVGKVRLGAGKNAAIAAWGVPRDIRRADGYTELIYGARLLVRTDARRIVGFEIFGSALRAKRGVTIGSPLSRWRRAYRGLRKGDAETWLLDRPGGNLTALHLRAGRVASVSMVWRGGTVPGGGGGIVGRGGGDNRFSEGKKGHPPCSRDGKSGWCWCTWWAYEKRPDVYDNSAGKNGVPKSGWDAKNWLSFAARGGGYATGKEPVVGALAVFPATPRNDAGHIAYVEAVNADGSFVISEYNGHNDGRGPENRDIARWQIETQGIGFVYGGPATGAEYIGHIVHWEGDTKAQKTSWLVVNRNGHPRRNWIPTSAIFNCLKTAGAPGPDVLPSEFLSTWLVDINGEHASCGGGTGGGDAPPDPVPDTPPPTSTPPPPTTPRTWAEQQGSLGANTFTNPYNASGIGQKIAANQWVEVSCKVHAPQIASANPDGYWYRIASAPWSNNYYAVANTFWNGDVPGQRPYTHNTDMAVPNC